MYDDTEEQEKSWAYKNRAVLAIGSALVTFGVGTALLFLVGTPLGWPLGSWFNLMFIGLGAVFIGVGVSALCNPTSVTVGGRTNMTTGQISGGSPATEGQGTRFGILFLLAGTGMTVFAIFMAPFIGMKLVDEECVYECDITGNCFFRDGRCVAGNQEGCATSRLCKNSGKCTFAGSGCWSKGATDAACNSPRGTSKLSPCRYFGECSSVGGFCKATTEDHCKNSNGCEQELLCDLWEERCINPSRTYR